MAKIFSTHMRARAALCVGHTRLLNWARRANMRAQPTPLRCAPGLAKPGHEGYPTTRSVVRTHIEDR